MRAILPTALALFMSLSSAIQATAQEAVPAARFLFSRDVDFYGADLTNLFDTDLGACERACAAQDACVAFTFNTLNGSCFPKSGITDRKPYAGALSARKLVTDPALRAAAENRAADLAFLREGDMEAARDLVAVNAARYSFSDETLTDLSDAISAAVGRGDSLAALRWAGKAAAFSDAAAYWASYADLALSAARAGDRSRQEELWQEAASAAINAFLRTDTPAVQAAALSTLAQALETLGRGRDMIPALRLAQARAPRADTQAALTEAIGKYGFRITDHRVDNDAAAPRICAEFSEKLVQAGVDYEPFVRTPGQDLVVQPEDNQLCIDGVAHGERYEVTFRAGLPAASGETLQADVALQVYVRDRTAAARFAGRAYVLPRSADAALPVETVNTDTLDLRLRRISDRNLVRAIRESYFGRPLSAYEDDQFAGDLAQEIWTGTAEVQNELNREMTTRLPLGDALSGQSPGIFALSAAVPGQDPYDHAAAMQWFVLSDLGLTTWSGVDGMQVAVRGLSDAGPRAGVRLSLISRANAVLGTATTDKDGFAAFAPGLTRGSGASEPALLMAEEADTDLAFLPLTDPAFDLSDRGVEGHPPAPPIDTFLTTDRGAYRTGETIFATALTRDAEAQAITGLPLTAILRRPDGVEYSRQSAANPKAGGHVFAMPLGPDVPRGPWRLDLLTDVDGPALASTVLLVEDFLPERIDFDLSLPDAPLRLGQTAPLSVEARYLFGAPGADLAIEGDLRLRATRSLAGWEGYLFGPHDAAFGTQTRAVPDARTDAAGLARIALPVPELDEKPAQPLTAEVVLRIAEGSGRPVERRLARPIAPDAPVIGIKPRFDDVLPEGAEAVFDLIAVGPEGAATPMPVRWTVNRVDTRYQWYQLYGNWEWEPVTRRSRVATGETMLGMQPVTVAVPADWGSYEIVVERIGAPYAVSSVDFSAGWYGGDGSTDTPDRLEMSLDSDSYSVGDTATLRVMAEGDGVALVSVLSNRVIERRVVPVQTGENRIDLQVGPEWGAGAYVTASVLQGMNVAAAENPARQLGLAHAAVRPGPRQLSVAVDAPAEVDGQEGRFAAAVRVEGIAPGETAFVTLAAVDVGILNLTGFAPPDVTDHYFGQRRLGVELRDIYGRLIDGMNGAMGRVRSGGDAAASATLQSPPPTEKLMAFFAGPVAVGPDGRAMIDIAKPAFNGTIRLMAVAWSDSAVGDASAEVLARDPVVVTASLPRFMAPGDRGRLLLELVHGKGPAGAARLEVFADAEVSLGAIPAEVTLTEGGSARLEVPVTARETGDPRITLRLTTPDGTVLSKVLTLPVRDNDPEIAVTRQFALAPGQSFSFDTEVLTGLRPGTSRATLSAGPLARFDVPGLLQQLDTYPYGCTEQVTSGAMPLLYLSGLATAAGLGAPAQIDDKIAGAIARVLTRQASNGAFGLWRAGDGEFWLDAYVTDFLSRAREQGHAVPDLAFSLAMDNLRNRVNYAPDFDRGGEDIAYALLVLAREGAASMGDLRYYADTKAEDFATPLAVAQLGAALAAYGDPVRADALFRRAGAMLGTPAQDRGWRSDFGSDLRDRAAVLKLSAEAGSAALDPARLIPALLTGQRQLSTQEAAQVVLASHALRTPGAVPGLEVNGTPAAGPVVETLTAATGRASVIRNISGTPVDVTMTTFGVPEVAPAADGYGYRITRRFFDMDGAEVAGDAGSGDRRVVVIEVTPFEDVGARLIVDDPLPAGFEIDNPNLLRGGDIAALDWLETAETETAEFRADRFIAAVDHRGTEPFRLAYVVRAVTPGVFHHPAARVMDMYRPEYRAHTDAGAVTVTP